MNTKIERLPNTDPSSVFYSNVNLDILTLDNQPGSMQNRISQKIARMYQEGSSKDIKVSPDTKKELIKVIQIRLALSSQYIDAIFDGETLLTIAAMHGAQGLVFDLLTRGASVNLANSAGETPLWKACRYGHSDVLTHLLAAKANIDLGDNDNISPLMVATIYRHDEICKELLFRKANVNAKDLLGNTSLIFAVRHRDISIDFITMLLRNKANINQLNTTLESALSIASSNNREDIAQLLFNYDSNFENLSEADAKALLELPDEADATYNKFLNELIDYSLKEMVASKSNEVKQHDELEVLREQHASWIEQVRLLQKESSIKRPPIKKQQKDAYTKTVKSKIVANPMILNELSQGETFLSFACSMGNLSLVIYLLDNKADPNILNEKKESCLWIAAKHGHLDIVATLIPMVNINQGNHLGITPSMVAIIFEHNGVANFLLEKGADINQTDLLGLNAMLHAILRARESKFIASLIKKKADINSILVDHSKRHPTYDTALTLAVQENLPSIVELLVANKAEIHLPNKIINIPNHPPVELFSINPIEYATHHDYKEIIKLLKKAQQNEQIQQQVKIKNEKLQQEALREQEQLVKQEEIRLLNMRQEAIAIEKKQVADALFKKNILKKCITKIRAIYDQILNNNAQADAFFHETSLKRGVTHWKKYRKHDHSLFHIADHYLEKNNRSKAVNIWREAKDQRKVIKIGAKLAKDNRLRKALFLWKEDNLICKQVQNHELILLNSRLAASFLQQYAFHINKKLHCFLQAPVSFILYRDISLLHLLVKTKIADVCIRGSIAIQYFWELNSCASRFGANFEAINPNDLDITIDCSQYPEKKELLLPLLNKWAHENKLNFGKLPFSNDIFFSSYYISSASNGKRVDITLLLSPNYCTNDPIHITRVELNLKLKRNLLFFQPRIRPDRNFPTMELRDLVSESLHQRCLEIDITPLDKPQPRKLPERLVKTWGLFRRTFYNPILGPNAKTMMDQMLNIT